MGNKASTNLTIPKDTLVIRSDTSGYNFNTDDHNKEENNTDLPFTSAAAADQSKIEITSMAIKEHACRCLLDYRHEC